MADTTAPTTPGTPTLVSSTASSASITWTGSTDDTGVTAYDVYNGTTLLGTVTGAANPSSFTDAGATVFASGAAGAGIAYGNGKFVALSSSGGGSYSTDGVTWTTNGLSASIIWATVTYGNGVWVALPYSTVATSQAATATTTYATSTDGITWTSRTFSYYFVWGDITFGNGKFVAVPYLQDVSSTSGSSTFIYSADGITWTGATSPIATRYTSVTYGNGVFAAVGTPANPGTTFQLVTSTDGANWTTRTLPSTSNWYALGYGNGKFVAFGATTKVAYSSDGITWTATTLPSGLQVRTVTYGNGVFVAAGYTAGTGNPTSYFGVSSDGITWTLNSLSSGGVVASDVAYGSSKFIALSNAVNAASRAITFGALTPGTSYTATVTPSITYTFNVKARDATGNVSSASGNLLFNTTGDTTAPTIPGTITTSNPTSSAVTLTWAASTDAVGVKAYDVYNNTTLLSSVNSPPPLLSSSTGTLPSSQFWGAVGYGNGVYVMLQYGGTTAARSTDGITWTTVTLPTNAAWRSVAYGNGVFVAVSYYTSSNAVSGNALSSSDGITWTPRTMANTRLWRKVVFGGGTFVAIPYASTTGNAGASEVNYSTDGITWNYGSLPTSGNWTSLTYGNGLFVAIAYRNNSGAQAQIAASSPDGITWTLRTLPAAADWSVVSYGGGKYVALSNGNVGAYSTNGITWTSISLPNTINTGMFLWKSLEYANGLFIAVGSTDEGDVTANVMTSPDGITWTIQTLAAPSVIHYDMVYGNNKFVVAVNNSGSFSGVSNVAKIITLSSAPVTYTASTTPGTNYTFNVYARDASGNTSAPSTKSYTYTTPPVTPATPTATLSAVPSRDVTVSWTNVANATSYTVTRTGTSSATYTGLSGPSVIDTSVADGTYSYTVTAVGTSGSSTASSAASITIDRTAPTVPTGVTASQTVVTSRAVGISWSASTGTPSGYKVYRDGTLVGSPTSTSITDTPTSDGTYSYTVSSVDTAGNESAVSTAASVPVTLVVTPATPSAPTASMLNTSTRTVHLTWSSVSGATSYGVYRNGTLVTSGVATTSYDDSSVASDGTYLYSITATNAAGTSAQSSTASIVVDRTAPGIPTGLAASQTVVTSRNVGLTWTAPTGEATTLYNIYRTDAGASVYATSASTSWTDSTITTDGTYTYKVAAVDAAGNVGTQTSGVSAVVALVVTPSTPSAPAASLAASPSRTVTVTWSAVSGATTYSLYMDSTLQQSGISGVSTTIASVADGSHTFTITATNAAGTSAQSPASTALVVDRTAPNTPAAPTAVQSAVTSRNVSVTWTAVSTATQYRVARTGMATQTVYTTTFTDSTLSADGTYSYTVQAGDADGNFSAFGPSGSVTVTLVTTPATPAAPTTSAAGPPSRDLYIYWTGVSGATSYTVYQNGTQIATGITSTDLWYTVSSDGTYSHKITATNAAGTSAQSLASNSYVLDRTPPSVPTGVSAVQSSPTSRNVAVSWTESTGTPSAYTIYRNGTSVGTSLSASYTDTSVSANGTYSYTVTANDAAGNYSAQSSATSVTVTLLTAPVAPSAPTLSMLDSTSRTVHIVWSVVSGDASYSVFRGGTNVATGLTGTSYDDTAISSDGTYSYTITATNAAGTSAQSSSASIVVDRTAPGVPTGVTATQSAVTSRNVLVSWTAPTGEAATSYRVYRGGSLLTTQATTSYTDTSITTDGAYNYTVSASDAAGNFSAQTANAPVTVTLLTAPASPAAPTLSLATSPSRVVTISWTAVSGATSYTVTQTGQAPNSYSTTGTSTTATASSDGTYNFTVTATNAAGTSAASSSTSITVDRTPPSVPTGLTAVQSSLTSRTVTVSWTASTGNPNIYSVRRDGVSVGTTFNTTLNDVSVSVNGTYAYTVSSIDVAGNESAQSTAVNVTVTLVTIPSAPAAPAVSIASIPSRTVAVTWSAVSGATSYNVYRSGTFQGASASTSYNNTSVPDGTYTWTVTSTNAAGESTQSSASASIVVDRTPPSAPVGVTATQSATTSRAVVVSWTAVAGSGITYDVLRGGVSVGTTASTSYTDTPATDGTYSYTVIAYELVAPSNSRQDSTASSASSVTVLLTPIPGIPGAPTLTLTSQITRDVQVSWSSVSGATSYNLLRNGSSIGTFAGTSTVDTTITTDGTYIYTVKAVNISGSSAASPATNILIDRTPPGSPNGVTAEQTTVTSRDVLVSWIAPSGETAVSYRVYRSDITAGPIATLAGTSYTDTSITTDGTYVYSASAKDAAGNWSQISAGVSVQVGQVTITSAPTTPTIATTAGSRTITLSWTSVSGAVSYKIYMDGTLYGTSTTPSKSITAVTDGTHTFTVSTVNAAGESAQSPTATLTDFDRTVPVTPNAPTVTLAAVPSNSTTATWASISDAASYTLKRNGATVFTGSGTSYTESLADGSYTYTVTAIDAAGNASAASAGTSVTVDRTAPAVPDAPTLSQSSASSRMVSISWAAVSTATSYKLYRDNVLLGTYGATSTTDTPLANGTYAYSVSASDTEGNFSAIGASASIDVLIIAAVPSAPSVSLATAPGRTVTVSWGSVPTADSYNILRDGVQVGNVTGTTFSESSADGTYVYKVQAVNAKGTSASSAGTSITVYRSVPSTPTAPTITSTARTITVTFGSVNGSTGYDVYLNGNLVKSNAVSPQAITGNIDGDYASTVIARNANGSSSTSPESNSITIAENTPDAPEAPTTVLAVAPSRVVTITWDTVARATSYNIRRNSTIIATGLTSGFYQDSPVDGTYTYSIQAVGNGNSSFGAASSEIVVVRNVLGKPSAPDASLAGVPSRTVTITWASVTNATGYVLRRNGVTVFSGAGTTFTEDVTDGSFTYTISAVNANGESTQSDASSIVSVDRTAPEVVAGLYAIADTTNGTIAVTWEAADSATSYELFRNGVSISTVNVNAYTDLLSGFGTFTYTVRGKDAEGNLSNSSQPFDLVVTHPDVTLLTPLINVTAQDLQVTVAWQEIAGADSYSVLRDNVEVYSGPYLQYIETLSAGTYVYNVAAVIDADNRSGYSPDFAITISESASLPAPTLFLDMAGFMAHLTWTSVSGATEYHLYRDGVLVSGVAGTDHYDVLDSVGTYVYTLRAVHTSDIPDGAVSSGEVSPLSNPVTAIIISAPAAPVLTYSQNANEVSLDWNTDADVAHYEVYRDGQILITLPSTQTDFVDSGLENGVYTYSVRAVDQYNGVSEYSDSVMINIDITPADPDVTPPATPSQPFIVIVGHTITVSWTSVADASFYSLRRNGSVYYVGSNLSYTETLANGAYSYTVTATDLAGNESLQSPPAVATLDSAPEPQPTRLNLGRRRLEDLSLGHVPALPTRPFTSRDY